MEFRAQGRDLTGNVPPGTLKMTPVSLYNSASPDVQKKKV